MKVGLVEIILYLDAYIQDRQVIPYKHIFKGHLSVSRYEYGQVEHRNVCVCVRVCLL